MIQVIAGNNLKKTTDVYPPDTSLRVIFEKNEIDYISNGATLDGSPLKPGDIDKTLADFGITEKCYLLSVAKADNG